MKRFLSVLLIAAMLLTVPVMPVSAQPVLQDENITAGTEYCPCGCGVTVNAVQWEPWNVNESGDPSDGHYYLTDDYVQNGQRTIMSGNRVVIDLRGKTLTTLNYGRLFLDYGYLAVMDTVGGGRMCSKTSGSAYGGVVMVAMNETADPTFAIFSGTLTQDTDNKSSLNGGLISVAGGCHFKMYGGRLINATTTQRGGAIWANSATANVEILGGSIIGCSAKLSGGCIYSIGNVTLKNCLISGSEAVDYGGNIYMSGGSLTVEDAVIENGVSHSTAKGGGNIYAVGGCAVTVTNSTVRNGYAVSTGGNFYFAKGTQILRNTNINSGVSGMQGANLYCVDGLAATTVDSCNISGDVYYGGGVLTLSGASKIGLNSNGLKLESGVILNSSGLTSGAEIYVDAQGVSGEFFKPAMSAEGYCPHCSRLVTWSALTDAPAGHCYLTADITLSESYQITGDTVVDLRGFSITSTDRTFAVAKEGALTLLDSVGGAVVKGSGNAENAAGGVIYNEGILCIRGGTYTYVADASKTVTTGGVVHTEGAMSLYGGILNGSGFDNTAEGALGGAICQSDGAGTFTMTAGRVIGGKAYRGGAACFGADNTVAASGGSFTSGTASGSGGNIRFNGASGKAGEAALSGVLIEDGVGSSASGGNISASDYRLSFTGCVITGGSCTGSGTYGGNITVGNRAHLTVTDCILSSGSASKGGNLYASSYLCSVDFIDCLVTGGKAATDHGGNFMVNHGAITFRGGELSYGTAKKNGGNVYTNGGNYDHKDAEDDGFKLCADASGAAPMVTTGTAEAKGGNIYSCGDLILEAAFIHNGIADSGKDIYYDKGANGYSLTVGEGLVGDISIAIAASLQGSGSDGKEISNTTAAAFPGKLILEGDYGQPELTVKDGKLYLSGIAVIAADGTSQWFADAADALRNCPANSYVKLFSDAHLELNRDCYVDLNGNSVTVSGDHTLYGMDSSGDDFSVGTGAAVWDSAEAVKTGQIIDAHNGNRYIAIAEGGTVTYHRLDMRLTDVTLRTSACGIYYKGTWGCDSVLAERIDEYGIAVSVYHMPGADFKEDPQCLDASYDGGELISGEKKNGVLIYGIMKEDMVSVLNARRGQMDIYAAAYLRFKGDAEYIISDRQGEQDDVAYSLYDTMDLLNGLIKTDPTHFRRYTNETRAFYQQWKEKGMNSWSFVNIEEPVKDDVIDVLMIGSSYCYYYVEELYEIAKAAGVKMRVCNVYYSGCKLSQHYNWWINDESNYQFYVTDGNGRKQYNSVSLEYCLAQGDWDVISLQESTSSIRDAGVEKHLANVAVYTDALLPYLKSQFPNADVYWHQPWSYQIGYDRSGYQMTSLEQQERDMQTTRAFALAICEKYDVGRINTGEAWQLVREGGYDNLCARLGVGTDHAGDYYHDGDIGGAQYLNACVWFEILTGQSCVGNSYVPTYTNSGKTYELLVDIEVLQNAAHRAVENLNAA